MPIIPARRDLPNQIDVVGPVSRGFNALGGIGEHLGDFAQTIERIGVEESRTEAADILSQAIISQKEALSSDKDFDDPALYQKFVVDQWKKAREVAESRTTNRITKHLVRRGLAQSEANLTDDFGSRLSSLREFKAQGHVVSYLSNVTKDSARLPIEDRETRRAAASAYVLESSAFNARQKEEIIIKLGQQMDEAAVLALKTDRNYDGALEMLSFENTPHLTDKRREEMIDQIIRLQDRAKAKGAKIADDIESAEMNKFYRRIMSGDDEGNPVSDAEIIRESVQAVDNRKIGWQKTNQIRTWLNERRSGVTGSREAYRELLFRALSPIDPDTGKPDPVIASKLRRYMVIAMTTPMSIEDKAAFQSKMVSIIGLMEARADSAESRNLSDRLKLQGDLLTKIRKSYSSWLQRDPKIYGTMQKAEQRAVELLTDTPLTTDAIFNQVMKEYAPQRPGSAGGGSSGELDMDKLMQGRPGR